jgi:hypothetical protein
MNSTAHSVGTMPHWIRCKYDLKGPSLLITVATSSAVEDEGPHLAEPRQQWLRLPHCYLHPQINISPGQHPASYEGTIDQIQRTCGDRPSQHATAFTRRLPANLG